jgi:hypothetical protein
MERRTKRITNEIKELYKSVDIFAESNTYFHVEDDNINFIYVMFVGTEKTPYEGGFYFVKFEIDAQVISWNRGICKGRGIATVDGEVACEADMLITIPEILEQFLPASKK